MLPLSELQEDVLDGWKRPAEGLPPPSWFPRDSGDLGPSMSFSRKIDLVQDAATDCSVVASLCAGVARAEKGHAKILRSVIYPYDAANGRPCMSENGKYIVRLNFNGCYRKVEIDDRLPTSSTTRVIHVVDRLNPGLLWPALIEKAYLKVRGGYDFPGSNSGTDLWILTGWIPEQVFLQSDDLNPVQFWRRISSAFRCGDVLITMGTGKMSSKTERELGLAGEHDYAVLDLRELDGQRLMLVKNPWCEGTSWRGKMKLSDGPPALSSDSDNADASTLNDLGKDDGTVQNPRDLLNADEELSPGTFWMDIDTVVQHFESIYLNWNPGSFPCRQDLHFAWDLSQSKGVGGKPRGRFASLSQHPQYTVTSEQGGMVWLLLWRHFQNAVPADATAEEIESDRYGIELSGHMSLVAFSAEGRRVMLPDRAVEKGWFVDSPQTLLKLDMAPGKALTILPTELELPATKHTFTLSTFSDIPVTIAEAGARYTYSQDCAGSWTKDTAGGNAHSSTYSTNPQYTITVSEKTNVSILLEAMNDELNVHFKLAHSTGQRIHSIRNRDIVFDSKDYRRGCCLAEHRELAPGQYTVICSTFEPQQLGDFNLLIESSRPVSTVLLPREGAGRIRVALNPARFKRGEIKLVAPLVPRRLVKLYAVVRYQDMRRPAGAMQRTQSSNRSLIRMSIETGRGPARRILITSNNGEYSDSAGGIRTEDIDLRPDMMKFGEMQIVMNRMYVSAEGPEERLSVDLFVDQTDAVSCGDWQACDD